MPSDRNLTYRNVMEALVAEEVERQFQQLQPKLARYLSKEEVTAFALNRLPALYATSEKGWRQQSIRGRRDCGTQIANVVRQAIVAVQRDPLRMESPLAPAEDSEAQAALRELKVILKREDITWRNLPEVVEQALVKTARGEITWQLRSSVHPPSRPGAPRPPGWTPRHPGWNSDLYKQ
ncbi:hypothetical protein BST81_12015 [Leptolyngbya sp. 'hensonii']|uniref:late competence development ComFB family protein n=1 Tax=Leptolyngbya sp. 'hensonii' TaxID=1922337 RepID=UPI00094F813B|nr:late competence development ComFB family protein [Leptolyngbya sp. 'hensonii']OLP17790.1 hypothetical protein BST81_12015 [Leptolyngbya sp. 'hensonii']